MNKKDHKYLPPFSVICLKHSRGQKKRNSLYVLELGIKTETEFCIQHCAVLLTTLPKAILIHQSATMRWHPFGEYSERNCIKGAKPLIFISLIT